MQFEAEKVKRKGSPLCTNQHSKLNVTLRRHFISIHSDAFSISCALERRKITLETFRDTMNQLHDSFRIVKLWKKRANKSWSWMNGQKRDILVFIMCHMQFENGCLLPGYASDFCLASVQFSTRLSFEKKENDF